MRTKFDSTQPASANSVKYHLNNNRVEGTLILKGVSIMIGMEKPAVLPETIYQYKTQPLSLGKDRVLTALNTYGYDPTAPYHGQKWYLAFDDDDNDLLLRLYPHGNLLGYSPAFHRGLPIPVNRDIPAFVKADDTMKGFLNLLGLEYEYPFYACMYAFQLEQVEIPETLDIFLSYNPHYEKYGENGNYTLIVARKTIDQFPYIMQQTRGDATGFGTEVMNPFAAALIDNHGKIVSLRIDSRWPEVKGKQEIQSPILSWQQALEQLPNTAFWESTIRDYRLDQIAGIEFSYCLTSKGIAVPVWNIIVKAWQNPNEKRRTPPPDRFNYIMLNFVIDAVTGGAR